VPNPGAKIAPALETGGSQAAFPARRGGCTGDRRARQGRADDSGRHHERPGGDSPQL